MSTINIDARVKFQGRTASGTDKTCGVVFLAVFAVHLIIGFVAWGNSNACLLCADGEKNCGDGWIGGSAVCIKQDLADDFKAKCGIEFEGRRLEDRELAERILEENGKNPGGHSVFGTMSEHAEIPGTIMPLVFVVSVGWIALLTYFSKPIVWATVLMKVACWFVVGIWMMGHKDSAGDDATQSGLICFVLGGLTLAVVMWKREAIGKAADHLEMACVCVRKNPAIFMACGIVQAVYIFYLLMFNLSLINGGMWWEVHPAEGIPSDKDYEPCKVGIADLAVNSRQFLSFGFMWTSMFFAGVSTVICSMITASWFWGQEDKPANVAIECLKTACTTSLGTVAFGSLVTAITDFLQKQLRNMACGKCWWTNPWGCLLHCVSKFFASIVESMTKFTLVIHAINGEPFTDSAKTCYAIMKKHFVNAVVTDQVGEHVLKLGAYVFSVSLGFMAWGWADANLDVNSLSTAGWADMGAEWLFYVFLIFYLILSRVPMFTILFVGLVSEMIHSAIALGCPKDTNYIVMESDGPKSKPCNEFQDPTTPFFVGVFIAAICSILLNFVASIILNCMDTIFLCHAIGKESGKAAKGEAAEMQAMLEALPQAQVVSGNELAGMPPKPQV